jgi:LysR family glycine cleavage system transcriptional activator
MRALPPPAWLRTFESAARHLSFTRAAHELSVTQSAVSQQIRLLEDRLGESLFHRLPQSLQLTEAGRAYLPVVRDAFERLRLGTHEVFGQGRRELVTIRTTPGFGEFWLAPRLPDLFARHPGIDVRIASAVWNPELMEAGVDLEVRYGLAEWPDLHSQRLTTEVVTPVCAPEVATRLDERGEALANERLLHTDGFRNGWAEWLAAAGADATVDAGSGCHFDTAIMPLSLAVRGAGVALGRRSLTQGSIARGELVEPFETALAVDEGFHLVWLSDRPLSAEADLVRQWLVDQADNTAA